MANCAIYLDHHGHTPLDPGVREAMFRAWEEADVNVHATSPRSEIVRGGVESARVSVAKLVGVDPQDVIFTSGATESNNLAIGGLAHHLRRIGRTRIVISAAEHASIQAAAGALAPEFEVLEAPILSTGLLDLQRLSNLVDERTGLVSVAAANHEIGTVQPLSDIAAIARAAGALMHSDLAQAAGKVPIELPDTIQLASVSAHKLYGPLGVGALVVRRPARRVLKPLIHGGGQEQKLRSGTLPAPLCIGFGAACELAFERLPNDTASISAARDRLLSGLKERIELDVNGTMQPRLPGNLNLRFADVDAEALVMRLRNEVTIATGSACHSQALEPSPVLLAMGLSVQQAENSVRIGLGRTTTTDEVDRAIDAIAAAVLELRTLRQSLSA